MSRSLLAILALSACVSSPQRQVDAPPAAEGEARGGLVLSLDGGIYWGESPVFTLTGAAPDENVFFVYSINGELVDGFCPGPLGGTCMDLAAPARVFDNDFAGADGLATGSISLPPLERLGFEMTVQAAIRRGAGGADSVVSNPLTSPVLSRLSAPEARDDGYAVDEDGVLVVAAPGILANDTDADGDSLEIFIVDRPTDGLLELDADGGFTYTPRFEFNGVDDFTYQAFDGTLASETAVVVITVASVNDVPIGFPEGYGATEDAVLAVVAPEGVLANDVDVEGDLLTASLVTPPSFGTLLLRTNGTFDYTPDPNFWGEDSFTYVPVDADEGAEVVVTLFVEPVNDAPVAAGEGYGTAEDVPLEVDALSGVLLNDTDIDGDRLEALVVSSTTNGDLILGRDGSFGYLPDPGWSGLDSFTYQAQDGGGLASPPVLVTISVGDVNDPPFALPEGYEGIEDTPLVIAAPGVLGNDVDLDGDLITSVLVEGVANGTLALAPDGSFTYTPSVDFWGEDGFSYQADDGLDRSEAVDVRLFVAPVNDLPVAGDDAYATDFGTALIVSAEAGVLANDSDRDGVLEPRAGEVAPSGGVLVLETDGSFSYTPDLCFTGVDVFTYVAFDGMDASAETSVSITVGAPSPSEDAFCNAYQPVLPRVEYDAFEWESVPVRTLIPPAPSGLAYFFHGSGGDVSSATNIENTELYNALYDRGIGVVVTNSTTRAPTAEWDTSTTSPSRNDDWARLDSLRDHLVATTGVSVSTPVLAMGFSNGGNYSTVFAEIALDEGWPFAGFAVHNSGPFGTPRVDGWWTTNVNDDKGTPGLVRSAYLSHEAGGAPSEYRLAEEELIHPMLFRKIPGTTHQESQDVFDDLVAAGMIDAEGARLAPADAIDAAIRAWLRDTLIPGPERYAARIRPAWGDHRISSQFADEEAAFLDDAL
jgi:hypothetical protein